MPRLPRPHSLRSAARRQVAAWLGCLALLLQLLVLPLSAAEPVAMKRLHGWGGYCHAGMQRQPMGHGEHHPHGTPASAQHCLCGASAAALGGLHGAPMTLPCATPCAFMAFVAAPERPAPSPVRSPAQPRAPPYA